MLNLCVELSLCPFAQSFPPPLVSQIVYDFTINALQAQRQASQPPAAQTPLPPQPPPLPTHERSGSEDGATNGTPRSPSFYYLSLSIKLKDRTCCLLIAWS